MAFSSNILASSFMKTFVKPIYHNFPLCSSDMASFIIFSDYAFIVIFWSNSFDARFPNTVRYLLMNSSIDILMAYPCFLILIASSIPAHLSYLHTSKESNSVGLNFEFGLIHLIYLGLDSYRVYINSFNWSLN